MSEAQADSDPILLGKPISDIVLGYLSCPKDSASGFLGCILVTDSRTRPLEFSYVSPVRPTTMQRILYGRTLDEHVMVYVIGKKLLTGISRKPDMVFVDSESLLGIAHLSTTPVAYLAKKPDGDSAVSPFSTLIFKVGDNILDQDKVAMLIATLEPHVALCDPFERMTEALKEALKTRP